MCLWSTSFLSRIYSTFPPQHLLTSFPCTYRPSLTKLTSLTYTCSLKLTTRPTSSSITFPLLASLPSSPLHWPSLPLPLLHPHPLIPTIPSPLLYFYTYLIPPSPALHTSSFPYTALSYSPLPLHFLQLHSLSFLPLTSILFPTSPFIPCSSPSLPFYSPFTYFPLCLPFFPPYPPYIPLRFSPCLPPHTLIYYLFLYVLVYLLDQCRLQGFWRQPF